MSRREYVSGGDVSLSIVSRVDGNSRCSAHSRSIEKGVTPSTTARTVSCQLRTFSSQSAHAPSPLLLPNSPPPTPPRASSTCAGLNTVSGSFSAAARPPSACAVSA
ncbi:hypothetical protein PLICRDRAFT_38156 [Plicaturopsis crispa FD-325 SS-3]|nr:hypothetical protein PLICRDRAFT_38156 [Plicaturopsis crispa FD-325 SS-3]